MRAKAGANCLRSAGYECARCAMKHVYQIERGPQRHIWKLHMVKQRILISSHKTSLTAIDEKISACVNTVLTQHLSITHHH